MNNNEMKNLVNLESKELISTIEFRNVINELRVQEGENKVENSKFLLRVEDELELDKRDSKTFRHPQSGAEMKYYELTEDEALLASGLATM